MKQLVSESFRYASGRMATGQSINVFWRGTQSRPNLFSSQNPSTPISNPAISDPVGNLSFYIEEGSYDFFIFGTAIPFDVKNPATSSPSSTGSAPTYTHVQASPASTWIVTHNLGTKPAVVLQTDSSPNELVFTDVTYPDLNTAVVEWPSPESGRAFIS